MSARRADASDAIVGRNIRLQRLARGLSQSDLGERIGVQQVRLVRAFAAIDDKAVRHSLLALTESMARLTRARGR